MKDALDNFSKQAATYASYRPTYPDELYDYLFGLVNNFGAAWDCATGNGQVACRLAEKFKTVYATDISEKQLEQAAPNDRIIYKVSRAEQTPFADNTFDLITIGTALHWFDFDHFYKEARRVAKPGAIIAAWVYNELKISPEIDSIIHDFHFDTVGSYWDKERRYVDENYTTVPFPFKEFEPPVIYIKAYWTLDELLGYLSSWSSVQHYIDKHQENPLSFITPTLQQLWGEPNNKREISFRIFMRVGQIEK